MCHGASGDRATRTRHFRRLALRVKVDRTSKGLTRIRGRKGGERYLLHRVVNLEGACNNDKTRRGSLVEPGKALSLPLLLFLPPLLPPSLSLALYVFKPTKLGRK